MEDSRVTAADTTSPLSGFSSFSPSNDTYDADNSKNNNELEVVVDKNGNASVGKSENGGFVSGEDEEEEEFEMASENLAVGDEKLFVNEYDDEKVRVLKARGEDEGSVKKIDIEESMGSGEGEGLRENEVFGGFAVDKKEGVEDLKSEVVGGGQSVVTSEVEELEADGVKVTGGGDVIVDTLGTGAGAGAAVVVGDVEGVKEIEIKGSEVPADGNVSLENGFPKISSSGEPTQVETVSGEILTPSDVRTTEVQAGVEDVVVVVQDDNSYTSNVGVENEGKEIADSKGMPDFVAAQNEVVVERVSDVMEQVSSAELNASDGNEVQAGEQNTEINQNAVRKVECSEGDKKAVESLGQEKVNEILNAEDSWGAGDGEIHRDDEIEGSTGDGETDGMVFGSSEAAIQFLEDLEHVGSHSGAESSRDHSQRIDGQIVTDSDEDDSDEEGDGRELFDSAALAALLKAATGANSDDGGITITSQDGAKLFSVERPAGLGTSLRSLKPPAARTNRTNIFAPPGLTSRQETETNLSEEDKKKLENLQQIRVKFLRLVHRLGHSPEDSIAAQVLYRLALAAGRQTGQLFNLDDAKRTALQLEAEGKDDLDFSLNILVIGKTGVGKSATVNSIFGDDKSSIHAFEPGTTSVKEIVGIVDGVKIRVIDTPGLKSSGMEQGYNRKVLSSIKKFTKKISPDIVLYVDRLDSQTRDLNDLPLLRSISGTLGSAIWRSAIVTLTHAASAPPDGPSGSPLSYEVFVAQRSHVVQQSIGQAVGDLRLMNPSLMNPVSLVENHPACRKNRDGQKVLPNGQAWKPQLLLLCYSMKILAEASSLTKPQEVLDHRKLFGFRVRSPPLPYLLSWLLQSRTHPKLPTEQGGDNGDSDVDLADLSDSDQEDDEDEYDQLPPFKPLRKSQIAKLSKEQRKAYDEEYDYRVKLLQKKQWREELKRMKEMKKKGKVGTEEYGAIGEDADQENEGPASVPVALPDMVLPPSFDSDNPAYRYRFLEPSSQLLARPVLDSHGWDHDCGYDGVNLEQTLAIANQFPAAVTVQVTKDKKEFNLHLDSSISAKHGENGSSMAGFDIQNVGKQLAYIVRGETKFKNYKRNKTAAGVSVTFLGENVATGFKLEDQIAIGKRLMLVGSTGTVRSQGDSAYGANLEVRLRDADYPIGQDQSSLGLSLVKWRGDLALGANLQSQISVGRSSKIALRAGLNNKLSGQITVRTSSSEQMQIALVGIVPVLMAIYKSIRPGAAEAYSMY